MSLSLTVTDHADARRDIESAARIASADPLDVLRALWRGLAPEQRAAFMEEAHLQPEAAPREVEQ